MEKTNSTSPNWPKVDLGPTNADLLLEYDNEVFPEKPNLFDFKYGAVIFDLDGTLWNNNLWEITKQLMKNPALNFPSSIRDFKKEQVAKKGFYLPQNLYQSAGLSYMDFLRNYSYAIQLDNNTRSTLDALLANNVKIGFLTEDSREATDFKISKLGLNSTIKQNNIPIVTPGKTCKNKPNTDGLIEISDVLGVPVNLMLVVGDSLSDIKMAEKAGIHSFLKHETAWPRKNFGSTVPTFYGNDLRLIYTIATQPLVNYTPEMRKADKSYLEEKVWQVLRDHPEGSAFFNNMDKVIKYDARIARLVLNESEHVLPEARYTILSGEISNTIWRYTPLLDNQEIIVVPGALRHGTKIPKPAFKFNGESVRFDDDSFYAGRTKNEVVNFVNRNDGNFVGTLATYLGSQTAEPNDNLRDNVHNIFRYWDFHYPDEKGNAFPNDKHPISTKKFGWTEKHRKNFVY
jgi:phosphoglycolate phosphatase-like HAD superfamily hydrolase